MSSAIDPTKPADGVPARKSDLRANLLAAKAEIEHGGFAQGFEPTAYGPAASPRVIDHLAAVDRALAAATAAGGGRPTGFEDVRAHGAIGDGAADDAGAIQAAIEAAAGHGHAGGVVYFPPGRYRVTSPLRIPAMRNHTSRGTDHAVALHPLWFLGTMGGGGASGAPAAGFGGSSVIEVDHAGVGLDLSRASDREAPAWFFGRIENLGFQDRGGASHGIKAYAVMHAEFVNLHLNQFVINVQVGDETIRGPRNGGGWYSRWERIQSYKARSHCGFFPALMHGAQFNRCSFSVSANIGLQLGQARPFHRASQPVTIDNTYVEHNRGYSIVAEGATSLHFRGLYAESNRDDIIRFNTAGDAQGSLTLAGCYFLLNSGLNMIEANAGGNASIHIDLSGTVAAATEPGSVAVEIPANPGRVAICDRASTNWKVESGASHPVNLTSQPLDRLRAYDCACSQLHANQTEGALNGRS